MALHCCTAAGRVRGARPSRAALGRGTGTRASSADAALRWRGRLGFLTLLHTARAAPGCAGPFPCQRCELTSLVTPSTVTQPAPRPGTGLGTCYWYECPPPPTPTRVAGALLKIERPHSAPGAESLPANHLAHGLGRSSGPENERLQHCPYLFGIRFVKRPVRRAGKGAGVCACVGLGTVRISSGPRSAPRLFSADRPDRPDGAARWGSPVETRGARIKTRPRRRCEARLRIRLGARSVWSRAGATAPGRTARPAWRQRQPLPAHRHAGRHVRNKYTNLNAKVEDSWRERRLF